MEQRAEKLDLTGARMPRPARALFLLMAEAAYESRRQSMSIEDGPSFSALPEDRKDDWAIAQKNAFAVLARRGGATSNKVPNP